MARIGGLKCTCFHLSFCLEHLLICFAPLRLWQFHLILYKITILPLLVFQIIRHFVIAVLLASPPLLSHWATLVHNMLGFSQSIDISTLIVWKIVECRTTAVVVENPPLPA